MKTEVFVQALNDVEDKYIEEAVNYKKTSGHMKLWRGIAIAACACLAASIAFSLIGINMMQNEEKAMRTAVPAYSDDVTYDGATYEPAYEAAFEEAIEDDMDMPLSVMNTFSTSETVTERADMAIAGGAAVAEEAEAEEAAAEEAPAEEADIQPLIIYSVDMNVQTTTFEESSAQLEQMIEDCGGYCESQYVTNNSGSYRNASYTIRVPADKLEDFLAGIPEIGTVTYLERSADDVSENYYDIESRLATAEAKLARLQQLMDEADDMEDIITLESAISDTQWEIDTYKGNLKYYDSRISYSTVNITLKEVYEVITEDAPTTFGEKVSNAFSQGVKGFTTFIKNIAIWFSGAWIWILLAAVIVIVVVLILRKIYRKK